MLHIPKLAYSIRSMGLLFIYFRNTVGTAKRYVINEWKAYSVLKFAFIFQMRSLRLCISHRF